MAATNLRGPGVDLGSLMDGRVEPTDGPGMAYQAGGMLDPRYSPANKDTQQIANLPGWFSNPYFALTDNIPSKAGTAALASAVGATVSVALPLTATAALGNATLGNPSVVPNIPLIPFQSTLTNKVTVTALDFGFTSGIVTSGSTTITSIPDSSILYPGQWICVGGAGNSTNTTPLIAQIQSIPSSSAAIMTVASSGTLTGAPIGSANFYGAYPGYGAVATAVNPFVSAGQALLMNPSETITRGFSISGSTGATGTTFAVVGYDAYGVIMHENVAHTGGATTFYTKKAYKYLASITPLATDAHQYTVGISDLFGFNLRSDRWEYTEVFWAGNFLTGPSTSGWTQALQASAAPSSATAADVRGTVQVSATGPSATGMSSTASNGTTARLAIFMSMPIWNTIAATPINTVPLLGYTQF